MVRPDSANKKFRFILASGSPRRRMLLEHLGLRFEVRIKQTSEEFPVTLSGAAIPEYLCREKARPFIRDLLYGDLLITADTIVWINGRVLNKPGGKAEAVAMLMELSGKTHEVFTAFCLTSKEQQVTHSVKSAVTFRELNTGQIENYLDTCSPYDKAGSYGAQDFMAPGQNACSLEEIAFIKKTGSAALHSDCFALAAAAGKQQFYGIEKIEGSYFNVMGFPLVEFWSVLEKFAVEEESE